MLRALTLAILLAPSLVAQAADIPSHTTPYAGMEARHIKALSTKQIEDLSAGRGMGLALAAELNNYPGPLHTLEQAQALGLDAAQQEELNRLKNDMLRSAMELGQRIIRAEETLNQLFAEGKAEAKILRQQALAIGQLTGELRHVHLVTHIATRDLLRPEQIALYNHLRGYGHSKHKE
jgi:hypothetical protein